MAEWKKLGFVRDTLEKECRLVDVLKFMESDEICYVVQFGVLCDIERRLVGIDMWTEKANDSAKYEILVIFGVMKLMVKYIRQLRIILLQ